VKTHPYRFEWRVYGLPHYKREIDHFLKRMYGDFIYFLLEMCSFFKDTRIRVFLHNAQKDERRMNRDLAPLFYRLYKRLVYILNNKYPLIFYRIRRNPIAWKMFWKSPVVHNLYTLTVFFFLTTNKFCHKKKLSKNLYLIDTDLFYEIPESTKFRFHFWVKPKKRGSFMRLFNFIYKGIRSPLIMDKKFRRREASREEAKRYIKEISKKGTDYFIENFLDDNEVFDYSDAAYVTKEDVEKYKKKHPEPIGEGLIILSKNWKKEWKAQWQRGVQEADEEAEKKKKR
jgi:hypothetical protein